MRRSRTTEEAQKGPVFVHAGLPKTGTTQLQHVLWHNRRALREQGVLYPGDRPRRHFLAALDVQDSGFAGHEVPGTDGSWQRLAAEVTPWTRAALVSHEMLAGAGEESVTRIIDTFPDRPVHLVLTVRDLSRVVPATWQERVKNGAVEPWQEFVQGVAAGSQAGAPHAFWRLQDAARVLETWARHLAREQIHLVTVPPPGGDQHRLLHRFCDALGLDPAPLVDPEPRANESVGAVEAALLQRFNRHGHGSLDFATRERVVKNQLVPQRLSGRPDRLPFGLPETAREWIEPEVRRVREAARRVDCPVEGDLADLEPTGLGGAPAEVDPGTVPEAELLDRALELLVAASVDLDQTRRRNGALRRELRQQRPPRPVSLREAGASWARDKSRSSRIVAGLVAVRRRVLSAGGRRRADTPRGGA